jgi:hypothetical protein
MPASALEQMLLELVNRARLDPAAEAARFGIDLNEGLSANTISAVSKQPLAMNETLLSVARAHSQDMIDRDYFDHDTPEGVTPFQRMTNAGYNFTTAGENIAFRSTSGAVTTAMTLALHQDLFVDTGIPGRGHRLNLLDAGFQEVGVGQVTGNFQGLNATMLTQDFGTSGSRQFLTGVSYTDSDHDNFYSIGEGSNGTNVTVVGGGSTATAGAGGYSLAIGTGKQLVTLAGGAVTSSVTVEVDVSPNTNAKLDIHDFNIVVTSASLSLNTPGGHASSIVALGTVGLTLTGDNGTNSITGTKGDDILNGLGGTDTAIYSCPRSAYSITQIGTEFQIAGPDGTDRLSNIENAKFSDQTITLGPLAPQTHWLASVDVGPHPAGWLPSAVGRFNADATSDLTWFNPTTGNIDLWMFANGGWAGSSNLGSHPDGWQLAGAGDFSHDGTSDLAWFNPSTGRIDIWKIANGQWAGGIDLGAHPSGWRPAAIGDFNGDGTSDIVWFNPTTGNAEIWKIVNGQWAGSVDLGNHPAGWQPVGAADFNKDGTDDLLWHNPTTNDVEIWKISNANWAASVDVGTHPTGSVPAGLGDFNRDGYADVLWFQQSTGAAEVWQTINGAWAASVILGTHPTGWVPGGVGDFNADGTPDILWRDTTTNRLEDWLLTNG